MPNLIYLVVFDRKLAEKAVGERYPTEGPHFLEKIIQANFEIPQPASDDLQNAFLSQFMTTCDAANSNADIRRIMNIFYDIVAPHLITPRDLTRLTNSISVSWPPVAGEVNLADFMALETIRVFQGGLFNAIRSQKSQICGATLEFASPQNDKQKILQELLVSVREDQRNAAKTALMRLFPRLENVSYASDFYDTWDSERRLCSERHFDTYFRMALGDETLPALELTNFIRNANDEEYVKERFMMAVGTIRKNGISKVPLLLHELNVHAAKIEKSHFRSIITAIFSIADEINREEDRERGFSFGDNQLRIHWLIRKLTFERCTLEERTEIFKAACQKTQVGWLIDFTSSAVKDYFPREGKQPEQPEKCLVEESYLKELKSLALKALENASSKNLIEHPRLPNLLFRWREIADDDGKIVKDWTNAELDKNVSVALFAKAFTQDSWSQGLGIGNLGDRVAMRNTTASLNGLDKILNVEKFQRCLNELAEGQTLQDPYQSYIKTFLEAMSKRKES